MSQERRAQEVLRQIAEEFSLKEEPVIEDIEGPTEAYTVKGGSEGDSIHIDVSDYSDTEELVNRYLHEAVHVYQNRVEKDYSFSEKEERYLEPLLEGQADFISGNGVYQDAEEIYTEFLAEAEEASPGKALERTSQRYAFSNVKAEVEKEGTSEKVWMPVKLRRDGSHHISGLEAEMLTEKRYGTDGRKIKSIDTVRSFPVDYREKGIDAYKLGDYLINVQNKIEEL